MTDATEAIGLDAPGDVGGDDDGAAAVLVLGVAWWRQAPTPAPVASIASSAEAQSVTAPLDAGAIPALADAAGEDESELYAWIADTPVARDAQDGAL